MSLRTNRASTLKIFSLGAVLLLVTAMPVWAQIAPGTILANVTDPVGAVVPSATVTVTNVETSFSRNTHTGVEGSCRSPALPVGKDGFKTAAVTGFELTVGQEAGAEYHVFSRAMQKRLDKEDSFRIYSPSAVTD